MACEPGTCAYGMCSMGYHDLSACGNCCGCIGGCVAEYEEALECFRSDDPNECPECTRSFGHKMDCSRGR